MKKKVIFVFFLLGIYIGLLGQFGYSLHMYEPEIIDVRSEALGRTSILSSSGANFIFNNPAMLSDLDCKNIQFNSRILFGEHSVKAGQKSENGTYTDNYDCNYPFHIKLNGIAFGMPYKLSRMKLGFGVGYRTYYDWGFNVHNNNELDIYFRQDSKSHGGFNTLVLGGGFNFNEKFYSGISISFPFLSKFSIEDKNDEGEYENETEGALKGTFLTFSSSYILTGKITFGARLRTGYDLEWKGESWFGDFDVEVAIPYEFGLALEIKPKSNISFFVEYLTRSFDDYVNAENADDVLYKDSESGYSIRTGFEFEKNNVFRGGFFIQSVPIYEEELYYDENLDEYVYRNDNSPQTELGFTLGTGLKINTYLSVDIFSSYSFLNYNEHYSYDLGGYEIKQSNDFSFYNLKIGCSMGFSF